MNNYDVKPRFGCEKPEMSRRKTSIIIDFDRVKSCSLSNLKVVKLSFARKYFVSRNIYKHAFIQRKASCCGGT